MLERCLEWIETLEKVIKRMAQAEDLLFQEYHVDRSNALVILLNHFGNNHNYFCGPSRKRKNVAYSNYMTNENLDRKTYSFGV